MTHEELASTLILPAASSLLEGWALGMACGTDAELLEAARGGDREAISRLVERHSPRLLRYLQRLVGKPDAAEDLLQETWLRVVERLDQHRVGRPFPPWLFSIGRNCTIDSMRRRRQWPRFATPFRDEAGDGDDPVDRLASPEPSALEVMSERALHERVSLLLPTLPLKYREALTLRFEEEMPLKEMAAVMRVPVSTAKTRVHRALNLLRQRLERQ